MKDHSTALIPSTIGRKSERLSARGKPAILEYTRWTASRQQLASGHLLLTTPLTTLSTLHLVRELATDPRIWHVICKALEHPVVQRIDFPHRVGVLNQVVVVPNWVGLPRLYVRFGGTIDSTLPVSQRHSQATRWLSILELQDWRPGLKSSEFPKPIIPIAAYRHGFRRLWAGAMVELSQCGVAEKAIRTLTEELAVPLLRLVTDDAIALLCDWDRSLVIDNPDPPETLDDLLRLRNSMQCNAMFPGLNSLGLRDPEAADPNSDVLNQAIEQGAPLTRTLLRTYGVNRAVVDRLRFDWPEPQPGFNGTGSTRLTRLATLPDDVLPQNEHELARLEALFDSPIKELRIAVSQIRQDHCVHSLRSLIRSDNGAHVAWYASFLFWIAKRCDIPHHDGVISLQRWIGQPTLAAWIKQAHQWYLAEIELLQGLSLHELDEIEAGASIQPVSRWPVPLIGTETHPETGMSIRFLDSPQSHEKEGEVMMNCAAQFATRSALARLTMCHGITRKGEQVTVAYQIRLTGSTVELRLDEIAGPRNSSASAEARAAAVEWAHYLSQNNDLLADEFVRWMRPCSGNKTKRRQTATNKQGQRDSTGGLFSFAMGKYGVAAALAHYRAALRFGRTSVGHEDLYALVAATPEKCLPKLEAAPVQPD